MRAVREVWAEESLSAALGLPRGLTAIIGGGGKTSLMLRLGRELSAHSRVILSTSTHIWRPEGIPLLQKASREDVEAALLNNRLVCVAEKRGDGPELENKLCAPELGMEILSTLSDYTLVEADGSKGRPLKAHASYEPVVPENAGLIVYVVGMDGLEKPIRESAHRPELYAALIGRDTSHAATPGEAALAVEAGLARLPQSIPKVVLLNKAEAPNRLEAARRMASLLEYDCVITALGPGKNI